MVRFLQDSARNRGADKYLALGRELKSKANSSVEERSGAGNAFAQARAESAVLLHGFLK
jgi:hypothetical protein